MLFITQWVILFIIKNGGDIVLNKEQIHSDTICHLQIWKGLDNRISFIDDIDTADALKMVNEYRKSALIDGAKHDVEHILYQIIEHDEELDIITAVSYFKGTYLSDDELIELTRKMPHAEFGVIHASYHKNLCKQTLQEEKSKRIMPITLKEANSFVKENHRHHDSVTGCKFAIGLYKTVRNKNKLIGVAICGRPVSRHLDNGLTLEINRLCVTESGNCCSMLYGAASRIAKEMGYKKVITYILESEKGTSLKASGFALEDDCCGGKEWTGERKSNKNKRPPREMKQRWSKLIA